MGRFQEVVNDITRAINLNSKRSGTYEFRGYAYYMLENWDDAINDLTKEELKDDAMYYVRATVHEKLKNDEKAIEDYSYLLIHDLDHGRREHYYYSRSLNYYNIKKYSESLDDINKAIEYNPRNGEYYSSRGYTCMGMDMYQEVIDAFTKAIVLSPVDYTNYFHRGGAYNKLKRYQEAVDDYTKAIELGPVNYLNYYYRALAYHVLKKYEEALNDYTKALAIKPDHYKSLYYRSSIWLLTKPSQTIDDVNKAFKIVPQDERGLLYMIRAGAYQKIGRSQQALADINRAIECNPMEASYFSIRAEIYEALAKRSLRRSVKNEYMDLAKRDYEAAERLENAK
jgi:tetratricopeptide (TPR) repeat protein